MSFGLTLRKETIGQTAEVVTHKTHLEEIVFNGIETTVNKHETTFNL